MDKCFCLFFVLQVRSTHSLPNNPSVQVRSKYSYRLKACIRSKTPPPHTHIHAHTSLFGRRGTLLTLEECTVTKRMTLILEMKFRLRKPTIWFSDQARNKSGYTATENKCLTFLIKKEETSFYLWSESKGADHPGSCAVFVFAYADCWFSHGKA